MKKLTTLCMTVAMIVLFFCANNMSAYACECGCGCECECEEEQQIVENETTTSWEDIMSEEYNLYFPQHDFFFQNIYVEDLGEKKVIEMGTFSFLMELTEDNKLLIQFYPPGDIGSRIDPDDYIDKEHAVQLGESGVHAYGYWSALSYLSTGEMIFEIPIDDEISQAIMVYESPWNGWETMSLVYFNGEEIFS